MPLIVELQDAFIKAMRIADALVNKTKEAQELEHEANTKANECATALADIRDLFDVPDDDGSMITELWMCSMGNTESVRPYVQARLLEMNNNFIVAQALASEQHDADSLEIKRLNDIICALNKRYFTPSSPPKTQHDTINVPIDIINSFTGKCSKCGVNRFQAPCPNIVTQCPMVGIAGAL